MRRFKEDNSEFIQIYLLQIDCMEVFVAIGVVRLIFIHKKEIIDQSVDVF